MSEVNNKWKVRFGQVLKFQLANSGKKLENYFYFFPAHKLDKTNVKNQFNEVDLNINRGVYQKYFEKDIQTHQLLNHQTVNRLNSSIVIVPGFGHHLINQKAFQDQHQVLKNIGFNVIYAAYEDSFKSNKKCSQRVYEIIKTKTKSRQNLIFFTYSKGTPVTMELLSNPEFKDISDKTKAMVSFAGAIGGSPAPSFSANRKTLKLLKLYRKLSKKIGISIRIRKKILNMISKIPLNIFNEWSMIVDNVFERANDIVDLPEGITDLTRVHCEDKNKNIKIDDSIILFSISAVYPESSFIDEYSFLSNLDDLFLYVSGREMYDYNVFNDTQILLPDSKFFLENGSIIDLGEVKTDHWGIALSRVFSHNYNDPFPRTDMVKSVIIILDEYFSE